MNISNVNFKGIFFLPTQEGCGYGTEKGHQLIDICRQKGVGHCYRNEGQYIVTPYDKKSDFSIARQLRSVGIKFEHVDVDMKPYLRKNSSKISGAGVNAEEVEKVYKENLEKVGITKDFFS